MEWDYTQNFKESEQERLERLMYIRNFDTPKKEKTDETNILRSIMENLIEREEDRRVGSTWVTSKEE